ncbi:MAG TPA: formyltransferase family protein [Thermoanaerobaculia bacterium]|nr:formyltransferase family protein [Thermoanaerobaculia bacterium]
MLNVAVLCSKRAPGLEALLERREFNVVCVMTTDNEFAECGVPVITHPIKGVNRRDYDSDTASMLSALGIDAVLCLGYLYILTEPMLSAFPDRIFNVHDADVSQRRYPGLHATRDAIVAGERVTRSSVHVVTAELDAGPVVAVSRDYPVSPLVRDALRWNATDIVRAYAYAHREWMMRDCWGELAARALAYAAAPEEAFA